MSEIQIRIEDEYGYLYGRYLIILTSIPSNSDFNRMVCEEAGINRNEYYLDGTDLDLFRNVIGKEVIIQIECKLKRKQN